MREHNGPRGGRPVGPSGYRRSLSTIHGDRSAAAKRDSWAANQSCTATPQAEEYHFIHTGIRLDAWVGGWSRRLLPDSLPVSSRARKPGNGRNQALLLPNDPFRRDAAALVLNRVIWPVVNGLVDAGHPRLPPCRA